MLPDMRLEGGTGDEVDRTAHRRPRRVLEGEERREPNRPLELDEHVDIAVGRGIAAATEPNMPSERIGQRRLRSGSAERSAVSTSSRSVMPISPSPCPCPARSVVLVPWL
jgi:hypothetical protein